MKNILILSFCLMVFGCQTVADYSSRADLTQEARLECAALADSYQQNDHARMVNYTRNSDNRGIGGYGRSKASPSDQAEDNRLLKANDEIRQRQQELGC